MSWEASDKGPTSWALRHCSPSRQSLSKRKQIIPLLPEVSRPCSTGVPALDVRSGTDASSVARASNDISVGEMMNSNFLEREPEGVRAVAGGCRLGVGRSAAKGQSSMGRRRRETRGMTEAQHCRASVIAAAPSNRARQRPAELEDEGGMTSQRWPRIAAAWARGCAASVDDGEAQRSHRRDLIGERNSFENRNENKE